MSANQPTAFATITPRRVGSHQTSVVIARARMWLTRASNDWLPRLTWSLQRTGRLGLSGMALLAGGLVFLISAHLPLAHEVEDLQWRLTSGRAKAVEIPARMSDYGTDVLHSLPSRAQMPELLGVVLHQADASHLRLDTGKYETTLLKSSGVVSYQISFPVTGPYPQVRQFIDATLTAIPAAAISELSLTRKTIGDAAVEAQIRMTVFTLDTP